MGTLITSILTEANTATHSVAAPAAIHAKKDHIPARSGFTVLTKQDVESSRRKAYAYAF